MIDSSRNDSPRARSQAAIACCFVLLSLALMAADESTAQRRERIEALGAAEKEELFRHREQFHALSPGEQQRIRQLHEQLQREPDSEKLRETMNRYCRWLATLPPYRRAELLELKPAQRVKQIKQLRQQEQVRTVGKRLAPADHAVVVRWMEQYATEHETRLLEILPEARRHQVAKSSPAMRHRIATGLSYQRWLSGNPVVHPPTTDREMKDLRSKISPEARKLLESRSAPEQARIMAIWLRQAAKQELFSRRGEGASLLPGFDDQLADFFEFQLNDMDRDRLMGLPGDEMQQKLREMYLMQAKLNEPGGRRPDRPGHGKKPTVPGPKPKKENRAAMKALLEKGSPPSEKTPIEKPSTEKSPPH